MNSETPENQAGNPMRPEPQSEHQWLNQLLGSWIMESECSMGPDQPVMKSNGTEVVRSLGGLWTQAEMTGEIPGTAEKAISFMTLGFDPVSRRFVGNFVSSCMTHHWIYNGQLDAAGKILTLDTEGPSFSGTGMAKYQDIIEIVDAHHRILRSRVLSENGEWTPFMTAHYHRRTEPGVSAPDPG